MKKIFVIIILNFTFITGSVFAEPNLVGTWEVETRCLEIGNNGDPYANGIIDYTTENIVIVWQQQGLYKGYTCGLPTPNGLLYGTIINNNLTLTMWDADVKGKMQGNNKVNIISQHVLFNPPAAPATCIGTLTRVSYGQDCSPAP